MTTQDLSLRAGGLASRILHRIAAVAGEALRRRKFKRLQDLDDHILDDIGVTRAEIEIATRLPFTHDAATELRRLSEERRRAVFGRYPLERYASARMNGPRRWL